MQCERCKSEDLWVYGGEVTCTKCGERMSHNILLLEDRLSNVEEITQGIFEMVLNRYEREELKDANRRKIQE